MTDQVKERLIYKRYKYSIAEEPLDSYLIKNKIQSSLTFQHTACWRCYEGTWKVKYKKLYLTNLEALTLTDGFENKVGVDFIFPGHKEVFAEWYSGVIRLSIEKEDYLMSNQNTLLGIGLFLKFKNGILIKIKEVNDKSI